jgi:hypothetical protein
MDLMPTQLDWHNHVGRHISTTPLLRATEDSMPLGIGLQPRSHRRGSAIRSRTSINPDGQSTHWLIQLYNIQSNILNVKNSRVIDYMM